MQCPILAAYPNVPLDIKTYDKITITDEVKTKILNLIVHEENNQGN